MRILRSDLEGVPESDFADVVEVYSKDLRDYRDHCAAIEAGDDFLRPYPTPWTIPLVQSAINYHTLLPDYVIIDPRRQTAMKIFARLAIGCALALIPTMAIGQTSPGLSTRQVPTAAQWNSYFAAKQDYLGFTPLNPSSLVGSAPITVTIGSGIATISLVSCGGNGQVLFWASSSWACSAQPSLGAVGNGGTVILNGVTSGTFTVQPSAAAGNWTLTFPTGAGSSGQVLSTNGSGVTSWINTGTGTVTSVTCGGGLTGGTFTTSGTCAADTGTSGAKIPFLNGANTWSAKQSLTSTDSLAIANGTTAQRPGSPAAGDVRYNSTLNGMEFYNGTTWIVQGQPPTAQRLTTGSGATYTPTTGTVRIRVRMVGSGGGGGARVTNNGATGGTTTFGTWTAIGGAGGANGGSGSGGAGGTGGADGTGTLIYRVQGNDGMGTFQTTVAGVTPQGGSGANSMLGSGAQSATGSAGAAARNNSGGGGQGASGSATNNGAGGGSGEYVEFWVNNPTATTYTITAGGNGGAAGTQAGGNGGSGIIIVEEQYQ